jgi:GNAT superfamily N-acetyltransferase
MMKVLSSEILSDGRRIEVLRIQEPDEVFRDKLVSLLGHKGEPWVWQMQEGLSGRTGGLENIYYAGRFEDRLIGNITIWRNVDIGCLAHVFTVPEMRKLGVARILLGAALDDFKGAGGRALVLTTGFESMPWRLYASFGFKGSRPEDSYGGMVKFFADTNWGNLFRGPAQKVSRAEWRHFIGTQFLTGSPGPEVVRSLVFPVLGAEFVEGQYISFMRRRQHGEPVEARVLEGPGACVLGCALVGPHPHWGSLARRKALDVFCHPLGREKAGELVKAAMDGSTGPLECHVDGEGGWKVDLLKKMGFREHRIPCVFKNDQPRGDLAVMVGRDG